MKKLMIGVGAAALLAGCAFNPESMPIGQKDSAVYIDAGAPSTLATKERKEKVAVIATVGKYKEYAPAAEALDSSLTAKLSGFSFFEVVDRKSQSALIADSVASGAEAEDLPTTGIEADFVVVARIASVALGTPSQGIGSFSVDSVFDVKWIEKASQRVIMTESIKDKNYANSSQDVSAVLCRAAETAARTFCAKIASKYAPPARVLQTRGDGAAARISLGKNYGLTVGARVCFYEIIDNSDIGGEKRDMNDIAVGEVKSVEEKTSWVKVDSPEKTNVRKGVYVRVLELEQRKGFMSELKESVQEAGLAN